MATKTVRHVDRGCEGWYRAIEITNEDDIDNTRIGERIRLYSGCSYTVKSIAKQTKPEYGGVVVLIEIFQPN